MKSAPLFTIFIAYWHLCDINVHALFFPSNSAYGIFAAIAVPIELPYRNVFVSYNFEANYNLPSTWGIPPILAGVEEERGLQCKNCTTTIKKARGRRSLLSRTNFYQILQDKFERSNYSGETCLLRLICEINAGSLRDINGVLGDLLHVAFSPTTSANEDLPNIYYEAEFDGRRRCCKSYKSGCKDSILELITLPLYEIIKNIK